MSDTISLDTSYVQGLTEVHPLYTKALPIWLKNQDAVDGQEAIKGANCERYLPKLAGMIADPVNGPALYSIYKEYANWFNASGRTADGLRGLVFRKEPVVEAPDKMAEILNDIDLKNQSLVGFSK